MEEVSRQRTIALMEAVKAERKYKNGFTLGTLLLGGGALVGTWTFLNAHVLVVIMVGLTGLRWGANYALFTLWTKPRLNAIDAKYPRKSGPKLPTSSRG